MVLEAIVAILSSPEALGEAEEAIDETLGKKLEVAEEGFRFT